MRKIYTYEECKERALHYDTRKSLKENEPGIYNKINFKKWGKDLFSHMRRLDNREVHYTKELCEQIVSKYEYLKDFREKEKKIYSIIHYHKWNDILLKLKPTCSGNKREVYVYEFPKEKSAYIGITVNTKTRDKEHHLKGSLFEWAKEHGITSYIPKIIEKDVPFDEAGKKEDFYMKEYATHGWNLINRAKAGSLGGMILKKEDIVLFSEEGDYIDSGNITYIEKKYNIKHNLMRICLRKTNKTTRGFQILYQEEWEKSGKPLKIKANIDKSREKKIAILNLNFEIEHVADGKMAARRYLGLKSSINCVTFVRDNLICNFGMIPQKWVCYYEDYIKFQDGIYKIYNPKKPKDKKLCFIPLEATQKDINEIVESCFKRKEWKKHALEKKREKRLEKKIETYKD